jgi:hypothetical protein
MRKLILLATMAIAMLATPAIAQAGCQARGGSVQFFSGYVKSTGYMDCTTGNGSSYEMRIYVQGSNGGAGYVSRTPAIRFTVCCPAANSTTTKTANFDCGYFSATDAFLRTKVVVENNATGSTDVAVGGAYTRPSACQ